MKHHIIDLFSGCGGLAYGFAQSGFNIVGGIEMNKSASRTASFNLHWKNGHEREHLCLDITKTKSSIFNNSQIDNPIIIGGPPCQAYSKIGRAKLNSLGTERAAENDNRGHLYEDFVRFALDLNSKAVVMENVPESVNYNGVNIPDLVCEMLSKNGYDAIWTILNSADYGVPQIRERVFVLAIHKDFGCIDQLPIPTHSRSNSFVKTQNEARITKFNSSVFFREPNFAHENLPNWITVGEAFSDLPKLFESPASKYELYSPNTIFSYSHLPLNSFQESIRTDNNIVSKFVSGHGFRKTPRDFRIFAKMSEGDNYLNAVEIANKLFHTECKRIGLNHISKEENVLKLKKLFVPPYSTEKFITKWKKLDSSKPSHTLVAHLSTDTYSHIHPWEPRGISVREAARLQSFPDSFVFNCPMGEAFKQIGNAVPPLLSKAIAKSVLKNLEITRD